MIDLKDLDALEADAKSAKQLGFQGKLCIHPNQVDICNRIFSPTDKDIDKAHKIVAAFKAAEAAGIGVLQVDGKFIDLPLVKQAQRIMKIAEKLS